MSGREALECGAKRVAVTSFNEWHEGTQIEPAAVAFTPEQPGVTTYLEYPSPEFYLTKTAAWVEKSWRRDEEGWIVQKTGERGVRASGL